MIERDYFCIGLYTVFQESPIFNQDCVTIFWGVCAGEQCGHQTDFAWWTGRELRELTSGGHLNTLHHTTVTQSLLKISKVSLYGPSIKRYITLFQFMPGQTLDHSLDSSALRWAQGWGREAVKSMFLRLLSPQCYFTLSVSVTTSLGSSWWTFSPHSTLEHCLGNIYLLITQCCCTVGQVIIKYLFLLFKYCSVDSLSLSFYSTCQVIMFVVN